MNTVAASDATPEIHIRPCSEHTGAEISGIDLSKPISPSTLETITNALHQWGVVLFRLQTMTEAQHIAFSRHFGELEVHVVSQYSLPEYREILVLSNILKDGKHIGLADAGQRWHSDAGYSPAAIPRWHNRHKSHLRCARCAACPHAKSRALFSNPKPPLHNA